MWLLLPIDVLSGGDCGKRKSQPALKEMRYLPETLQAPAAGRRT